MQALVSINTVFYNLSGIENCFRFCVKIFGEILPEWIIFRDVCGNLICLNPVTNKKEPICYLNAHIDTVGADETEWVEANNSFKAKQIGNYLIGRSVNDCKAGIAFILYTAFLLSKRLITKLNIGFIISFREEGNKEKTLLIISSLSLLVMYIHILCLENTIGINKDFYKIGVYDSEPYNIFIKLSGNFYEFRSFLNNKKGWKPMITAY